MVSVEFNAQEMVTTLDDSSYSEGNRNHIIALYVVAAIIFIVFGLCLLVVFYKVRRNKNRSKMAKKGTHLNPGEQVPLKDIEKQ